MDSVNQKYFDKFSDLEAEYDECSELLSSVEIMSDNKLFEHYRKLKLKNEKVVISFKNYKQIQEELELAKELFETEQNELEKNELAKSVQELEEKLIAVFEETKMIFVENGSKENQKTKIEISYKTGDKEFVFEIKEMIEKFTTSMSFVLENISQSESQTSFFVVIR